MVSAASQKNKGQRSEPGGETCETEMTASSTACPGPMEVRKVDESERTHGLSDG